MTTLETTPSPAVRREWSLPWHLASLVLLVLGICLLYIEPPGWGDDLAYWNFGLRLHELGRPGWDPSFHGLRWPVWGVCWALQGLVGLGLVAYTGAGIFYMCAGAVVCFLWGWTLLRTWPAAWACGLAFLFHPLVDTLCNSPWPDLSEGIWAGAAMLAWWKLMHAERAATLGWAALTGACVFVGEANRLTGLFIVPVLLASTLLFFPRRFARLLLAGAWAVLFYAGQTVLYHGLTGDWLHDLHANLRGKGVRGTEPVSLATMPFRFLPKLWFRGPLAPVYCVLTLLGTWVACRGRRAGASEAVAEQEESPLVAGRVVVMWLFLLYLEYACAPQSLSPWRPVVRDGARFLGSLAVPMAVLSVAGLWWIFQPAASRRVPGLAGLLRRPAIVGVVLTAGLVWCSLRTRPFTHLGFITPMRAYLREVKPGTRVLAPAGMRTLAIMAEGREATKLHWLLNDEMPEGNEARETQAAQAEEFWYGRHFLWSARMGEHIHGLARGERSTAILSPFIDHQQWQPTLSLQTGATPDINFFRRRPANAAAPQPLAPDAPELGSLFNSDPGAWSTKGKEQTWKGLWAVPAQFRGRLCTIEGELVSDPRGSCIAHVEFKAGKKKIAAYRLNPFRFPEPTHEVFTFLIPAKADTCEIHLTIASAARMPEVTNGRILIETDPAPHEGK